MSDSAVLAWADDLFVHSELLSRWVTDYVDLEESLACGTIAQEALAHSVALMSLVGLGPVERDARMYRRSAGDWYVSRLTWDPDGDWSSTVSRGFLLTQGLIILRDHVDFARGTRSERLMSLVFAEQDLHAEHWLRWVEILASDGELRPGLIRDLGRAFTDAADLFGRPQGSDGDEQMISGQPEGMYAAWATNVRILLSSIAVDVTLAEGTPVPRRGAATLPQFGQLLSALSSARAADGGPRYPVYR
jgi:1,2-phenylacetyl-CoA epoxidase catalytic subunit